MSPSADPVRAIPARPSLEHDRKAAKALVKAHARADAEALARIRAIHPRFAALPDSELAAREFKLADAQWVIAREYGLPSWPRFKELVAFLNADAAARAEQLLRAAIGDDGRRAHELLARDPELARFDMHTACAAADEARVEEILARDEAAATRPGGPFDAEPLWTLCWSNLNLGPVAGARIQIAQKLLRRGANPDAAFERESRFGPFRATTLLGCVERNQAGLAKTLMEGGAHPDDNDSLYHACEHDRIAVLRQLLAYGATPARTNALLRALDFPDLRAARLLLEHGADPGERAIHRETYPLHHVALRGRGPDAVDLLLDRGADIEQRDEYGHTPYQHARLLGQTRVAEHLLARGADPTLPEACELLAACAAGETERARALHGADPRRFERLTQDEQALPRECADLWNVAGLRCFLELGLPADTRPEGDSTPLDVAAFWGHVEMVELLLAHGANPNVRNPYGGNALGALCFASRWFGAAEPTPRTEEERQRDWAACAERLVEAGAEMSSAQLANASPAVAEVLRRFGAPEPDGAD